MNIAAVSSAGMTCHPRGDSWVTAADVAGTPKMPSWHEFLKPSRLARPLRMCFPCVGINNGGRFLHEAGCEYTITDAHDIIGSLRRALLELDPATENNMHLGSTGDVTQVQLKDLKRPVDVLMAGSPCPSFSNQGRKKPKEDPRTLVTVAVLHWVVFLIKFGGLLYVLLENVKGILNKLFHNNTKSFMDLVLELLQSFCPEFVWRVDVLNASDYKLAHKRNRVFLQGIRRCVVDVVPPPLPSFGTAKLRDFLKPDLPNTPRSDLTPQMQANLISYEEMLKKELTAGLINAGDLVVCEVDRACDRVYKQQYHVEAVPTLKTGNKYLFIMSTDDLHMDDSSRAVLRWLMPCERPALQGVDPCVSLTMNVKQLIHACGNAYPVPLIAACANPAVDAMSMWPRFTQWVQQAFPDADDIKHGTEFQDQLMKILNEPGEAEVGEADAGGKRQRMNDGHVQKKPATNAIRIRWDTSHRDSSSSSSG